MRTGIIVDDAAIMRMRLREILEPDYEILAEAENGEEAVDLCKRLEPDFVTLDISMPRTNGMDALKGLKGCSSDVKVIMVSAVGQKRMVIDALQMGASDFVIKPFEADRVKKAIGRIFDGG
jgi:two-component system chemotaxis response regulator CheY